MITKFKPIMLAFAAVMALAVPAMAEETRAAAPTAAAATANPNLALAVVDIQQLLRDSKAAQGIESQLTTIRKNFQTEVETDEKALRAKEKEVKDLLAAAQKDKTKEEEAKAKVAEFQKQVTDAQKKIQEKKNKLDKAVATAIGKLRAQIVKVVAEIADKKGLDLVLARTDVVIVSKTLDITAEVLERINKDLPSVTVVVE